MKLNDLQIRAAKPEDKLFKLSDGEGLQLWVYPEGAKRWRLSYRFSGKQKVLAIGVYPKVSLRDAREAREDARRLISRGQDPSAIRKNTKALTTIALGQTFETIAAELIEKKKREGKADTTIGKMTWLLELAYPTLGSRPIASISPQDVLTVLKIAEARGRLETAKRLRATIGQVFRYAIATGRAEVDPTSALRGAIASPVVTHRAALVTVAEFSGLLKAISTYHGAPETRIALQLLALTFIRPGELRRAEWVEFDLQALVWTIPAPRMKMRLPHKVPLPLQACELLEELKKLTGRGRFLFPSLRSPLRCMSENTINAALRRLDYSKEEMTGHGFRSSASTILNESGLWNPDAIERQLAHKDKDAVRRAYARGEHWDERVRMMQWWADKCAVMLETNPQISD